MNAEYLLLQEEYNKLQKIFEEQLLAKDFKGMQGTIAQMIAIDRLQVKIIRRPVNLDPFPFMTTR